MANVILSVTVLGSSGMYPTADRAASGYLVELGDFRLAMDLGSGSWQNFLQVWDYGDMDGVLLTHRHPDHVTDVFQVFHARRFSQDEAMPRIPLWAPRETLECVDAFATALDESFDLRPIAPGDTIAVGDAKLSFFEMAHPVETVGVRTEIGGVTLAYTADTGPSADVEALARGADVLISEATFQDRDEPFWEGHMSAAQAAAIADRAGVGYLVLSHLPPERDLEESLDEARDAAGDTQVDLAEDGLQIEVGE